MPTVLQKWKIQATIETSEVLRFLREHMKHVRADDAVLQLRDAYVCVSKELGCAREKMLSSTGNVEKVKLILGPVWAHISEDHLREILFTCAKNPERYGGGWGATESGHGPRKGWKDALDILRSGGADTDAARRLREPDWVSLRQRCFARDAYRCRICNSDRGLETHHRTYDTMRTDEELNDLTTLCRACHELVTAAWKSPKEMQNLAKRLLNRNV